MSKFTAARTEEEVGITCRIGDGQRFQADFKTRFSDFHVNEIDPNGRIVQLTTLEPPVESKSDYPVDDPDICSWIPEDVRTTILELQGRLKKAVKENLYKADKLWKEKVHIKVTSLDKEQRTKIHKWMGNFDKLGSETVDKDGDKFIVALYDNKQNRSRRRPARRAKYTHFVLYKEGVDTFEAIGNVAKRLRVKPNFISFCGTKDKHGKTTQRMCITNIDAHRLVQISRESRSIKLGNFEYLPHHLRLGDLKGNHFKILLRNAIAESDETIASAVDSLKSHGYINYFGLQRFGSYEVSTHAVGKSILQNKWIEAFDLMLKPKNNDHDFMVKAKREWFDNRDPNAAIKFVPNSSRSIESTLLHGLAKYYSKNDFIGVFLRIPRNTRHLYLHSFQSFLWNQVASFRIKEMGLKPIVGDLVYADKEQSEFYVEDILDEDSDDDESNNGQQSSGDKHPAASSIRVKALTEEDLPNYTIYDVVIPIHGTQIRIPESRIRDFYEQILKEQGLEMDCFLKFKPMSDQPKGAYRKLVVSPQNVSHKIIPYNDWDPVDTFIPSVIDKLNEQRKKSSLNASSNDNDNGTVKCEKVPETESPTTEEIKYKKCVIVEMSLPASSYATMALREIINLESRPNSQTAPTTAESTQGKRAAENTDEPERKRTREDKDEIKMELETDNEKNA